MGSWKFTAASLLVAFGVLVIVGVLSAGNTPPEAQVTGLLHYSGNNGVKDITLTILNPASIPQFCQGVVDVKDKYNLLKRVKKDAGVIAPLEERVITLRVVVPDGAVYDAYPLCVPQN